MKNILGYYLMPHPPIIIPDIGKGEEQKIQKTIDACKTVGEEIANFKPETIVVITPHATRFPDAIAISHEDRISGDLSQFGCSHIKMDVPIDREFNESLNHACKLEEIPTTLVDTELLGRYNHDLSLDHGTMVPLYFVNKHYNDYKLVHITYSALGDINLYKFGMQIQNIAKDLGRNIVVIASGDLSHALKEDGPYSYSEYGAKFDNEILWHLENGNVTSLFNMDETMVKEAAQCGLNSVNILVGSLEGKEFKGDILSYEGPFGVGYAVIKFQREEIETSGLYMLTRSKMEKNEGNLDEGNPYTNLARESLKYYFKHGEMMEDISNLHSELLNQKHGVFVSLKKLDSLRGCIGTILPATNSVGKEIIRNTVAAAFKDPRFPPLDDYELDNVDISVDVIMDAVPASRDELDPKRYGVIVSKGDRVGLLLPDLEGVDTVDKQLSIACNKAVISPNDDYTIEKFEVIRYKESK
ncbi:AmmeMemoRadiSam system protein A [Clostridium cylindrosporum]|uniref:AMMECR1 domain-containing protein n=1 Tax=Clostridium cylindrosporum DSM 605 TaxID=1121307 RepID=A0A0J8D960_CLOCY|nr:AmmeMemoRadiSam system protein A [Clostridium cylindrosporum]KMT22565.1 hypothetical protein CLCY_10c01120 [Clostridium cylindrosporum DSM 605]